MCTKFHWCLIKNNKVIEVWNFFYKSAFWLVGLDGKIMDLHQQNFSGQYWGVKLTCIPNFSEIGQFLQKLSHFIEFRLVGWLGWLGPSDFKKISRWKADGHNISAYKKSSWYLKAFKSYPIFKVRDDDDDDDDADIIGGWIIVRSVLTPSRTKTRNFLEITIFFPSNDHIIFMSFDVWYFNKRSLQSQQISRKRNHFPWLMESRIS